MKPDTPLLDTIPTPDLLRALPEEKLTQVASELRSELVDAVSETGGHLGAGLGVVELTVALHYVFDTPADRIIWDVGHQAYPHKILTGRRDRIRTLRQEGGLSGFTRRVESEYDPFGAAHSSTSISAGLGMAVARDLSGGRNHVIAVIGDGAMSAGMAYEAMNNAGALDARLIVILNDNDMSIAPPSGAMSHYLARLASGKAYQGFRDLGKKLTSRLGKRADEAITRAVEHARGYVTGGTMFEELGFFHIGPIDGHSLEHLVPVLRNVRDHGDGPVLIHVITKKGKGYPPAEAAADKYHGVNKFDVITGAQAKAAANAPAYTRVFAESLVEEANHDDRVVAVTAAMPSGTGLDLFGEAFPERTFDVGIAEQHAVTFAAGLATEGYRPFCAIYSTFLQRAYDQVVHDVAIQKLPVRFPIDRAGYVGADGATHCGAFDVAYLSCLPGMVVMAAADEAELKHMVRTAAAFDEGPIAFRYPRGNGVGVEMPARGLILPIGRGRVLRQGTKVALLSLGTRLADCLVAAEELEASGLSTTVADARFAKPLDTALVERLAREHQVLITVEEGSVGGFGSHVLQHLAMNGLLDGGLKVRPLVMPTNSPITPSRRRCSRMPVSTRPGSCAPSSRRWAARPAPRVPDRAAALRRQSPDDGARSTRAGDGVRLDELLVMRGFYASRSRARDAVLRGTVSIDGQTATKPGLVLATDTAIAVADPASSYVSRAALKLVHALDRFQLDPSGRSCLDLGASTGGFTQVLLERNAAHVVALDVGHGQIHPTIAADPRVTVMEGANARELDPASLPRLPDAITCDVSFISLRLALPPALRLAKGGAWGVFLVKPQFEVGREAIGKGGLVRDGNAAQAVADDLSAWLGDQPGWRTLGLVPSPIVGGDGNREFLLAGVKDR